MSRSLVFDVEVVTVHGGGHGAVTWILLGTVLIIGVVTVSLLALVRLGRLDAGARVPLGTVVSIGAAAASGQAAAIHFAMIGAHFAEWWVVGLGFAAVAWFQAVWAALYLVRPTQLLRRLGLVVNAGVIGVWLVSRSVGLPFGPDAWRPEPIGSVDVLATALEASLVVVLLLSIRATRSGVRHVSTVSALQYGISAIAILGLIVTLALAGQLGDPHLDGSHPDESGARFGGPSLATSTGR